jgi:hypothetical protein
MRFLRIADHKDIRDDCALILYKGLFDWVEIGIDRHGNIQFVIEGKTGIYYHLEEKWDRNWMPFGHTAEAKSDKRVTPKELQEIAMGHMAHWLSEKMLDKLTGDSNVDA